MAIHKKVIYTILMSWMVFFISMGSFLINGVFDHVNYEFVLLFVTLSLLFYAGFLLANSLAPSVSSAIYVNYNAFINFVLFLGAVVLISRIADRFVLRPVAGFDVASVRASRADGSNILSILSVIGYYFLIVLIDMCRPVLSGWRKVIILLTVALLLFDIVATGSRGIFLFSMVVLAGNRFSAKAVAFLVPLLVVLFGLFYVYRFSSLSGGELSEILVLNSQNGYAEFVPITENILQYLSAGGIASVLVFSLVQVNQYLSHSFFEFAYIFAHGWDPCFDVSYFLPSLSKIIEPCTIVERPNLYYTLFGSAYIAFGVLSVIAVFFSGVFLGFVFSRSARVGEGTRHAVLLALFLSLYVNTIGGFDLMILYVCIILASFIKIKSELTDVNKICLSVDGGICR